MVWRIIVRLRFFAEKCREDNISAFAAQSAFFIVLSLIPFIMLFISLVQYTPVTEGMILGMINRVMPTYISPFLIGIIHEMYNKSVGIVSIAAITAVWSAAKGIQYLMGGLNRVYDIEETRNWVFLRFRAILYTLILVIVIVASLTLMVFGNSLQYLIVQYLPIVSDITQEILKLRSLILLAILSLFFAALFRLLPNRRTSQKPDSRQYYGCGWMVALIFWDFHLCRLFQWIFHVWQPDDNYIIDALVVFWHLYFIAVCRI